MSLKTMLRVWEHSETKRAARCLMLALADFANDDGICWPGTASLAEKINESSDYTDILIKKCIESGELAKHAGQGRGHKTRFAILCGLAPDAQKRLKGVLQKGYSSTPFIKGVAETPFSEKRGTPKGVLVTPKRGTFSDTNQASFDALECAEPPIDEKLIRHDPVGDHDPTPTTHDHDSRSTGGGDDFYFALRQRKIGQKMAREIATRRTDQDRVLAALDSRPPDARDPGSPAFGKLLLDILDGVADPPAPVLTPLPLPPAPRAALSPEQRRELGAQYHPFKPKESP